MSVAIDRLLDLPTMNANHVLANAAAPIPETSAAAPRKPMLTRANRGVGSRTSSGGEPLMLGRMRTGAQGSFRCEAQQAILCLNAPSEGRQVT